MHARIMHAHRYMHASRTQFTLRACLRACTQARSVHTYIPTYIHTYIHTCMSLSRAIQQQQKRNRRRYGVRSESTRDGQFTIRVDPERLSYVCICIYASIIYSYIFIYAPARASRLEI